MSCNVPVSEFARQVGVSNDTVYRWAREGRIEAVRVGPRLLRVDPATFKPEPIGGEAA